MAIVLIAYFVFLFRASDKEYREVINEKFDDKSARGKHHVDGIVLRLLGNCGRACGVDALRLVQGRHDLFRSRADVLA
ncbi:hypothetical protein ACVOMV_20460 [Mesorhizobium atlanticum]